METGFRDSRRGDSDSGGGLVLAQALLVAGLGRVDLAARQKLLRRAICPTSAIVIGGRHMVP